MVLRNFDMMWIEQSPYIVFLNKVEDKMCNLGYIGAVTKLILVSDGNFDTLKRN